MHVFKGIIYFLGLKGIVYQNVRWVQFCWAYTHLRIPVDYYRASSIIMRGPKK